MNHDTSWHQMPELPEPLTFVWCKRHDNSVVIAYRTGMPLSTNHDASVDCNWYGKPVIVGRAALVMEWNFSDVTVLEWREMTP